MVGYELFLNELNKLDYYNRHRLIGNIFDLSVLVYDLIELDGRVYVKIYDGEFYYQFCLVFDKASADYLLINKKNKIILCKIFVKSILIKYENNEITLRKYFYYFLKLLVSRDVSYFDYFL